jgi:hypothetical protein
MCDISEADGTEPRPPQFPAGSEIPRLKPARLSSHASAEIRRHHAGQEVGGRTYQLVYGDLHRHTDFSLCQVPLDGTMDDAYRYAIDAARLDFLGITDHTHDLAMGDGLSQIWWRSIKEVTRHDLSPVFIPFFAYERSRGGEDHNVISLRHDTLKPHTYPHEEFWKELTDDTITIPHQTITAVIEDPDFLPLGLQLKTWRTLDAAHRPLLEMYQGCRDRSIERDAHEALKAGNLLGFIASSDHMSTAMSYACVWTPHRSREAIFQAFKDRRTFGAMDTLRLMVRAGEHWMGESFQARRLPPLDIEVEGTAALTTIDIVVNGEVQAVIPQSANRATLTHALPDLIGPGRHYIYVRVNQQDGSRAWSSPIWVDLPER